MKARRTAAIVVRSLLAALGEVCVAGLVAGWVVGRLVMVWPVMGSVEVAVDICVRGISLKVVGWKARPRSWWRRWLGKPLGC